MFLLPQQDTNPPAIPEDLLRCYYRISPNLRSVVSNLITFLDCLRTVGHGNDRPEHGQNQDQVFESSKSSPYIPLLGGRKVGAREAGGTLHLPVTFNVIGQFSNVNCNWSVDKQFDGRSEWWTKDWQLRRMKWFEKQWKTRITARLLHFMWQVLELGSWLLLFNRGLWLIRMRVQIMLGACCWHCVAGMLSRAKSM